MVFESVDVEVEVEVELELEFISTGERITK